MKLKKNIKLKKNKKILESTCQTNILDHEIEITIQKANKKNKKNPISNQFNVKG